MKKLYKIYTVEISADYGLRTLRGSFESNRDKMSWELYWYKSVFARNMMEAEKQALIALVKERNQFERDTTAHLNTKEKHMIAKNSLEIIKQLDHTKEMIKALVLTGFRQGKVEFYEEDYLCLEEVIDFIKTGNLPEQVSVQTDKVKSPGDAQQIEPSPLPPVIRKQSIPLIEEVDLGDGIKRQVIIKPEDVVDEGKEPRIHILVEDPADEWKDGIE